ncbi:hypothetical protein ACFSUM_18575 [Virgibacillus siamensis]|uniref:hypothetical protein n=1 Tax=Virgibacillus siamensis TaxID=480071 RepID=UPI00362E6B86
MEAALWIEEKLGSLIHEDEYGKSLVLGTDRFVQISTFLIFFGAAIEDDSKTDKHLALIGEQTFEWNGETITRTGEELGYKEYFDAWHAEGLI